MKKIGVTLGTCLGVSFCIVVVGIVSDAWLNNTMGEYYNPTDVWGTMKWGYAAKVVAVLTVVLFTIAVVLVAVGAALSLLIRRRGRVRE